MTAAPANSTAPPRTVAVIGGGIVGLAAARALLTRRPALALTLLEKEPTLGAHQTGRNSGVIHSGVYYKPGSNKAKWCTTGKTMLERFCDEHAVPYERCGKVIVATSEAEAARLPALQERGAANGVDCRLIGPEELRDVEPHAAGLAAVHVRTTGIVDFARVAEAIASDVRARGGDIRTGARVVAIDDRPDGLTIETTAGDVRCDYLVNCAGLYVDHIARLAGARPAAAIIPFRGEYYELAPEARRLCRNLIYPVPDPAFPFLGVHFTRMMRTDEHGHLVECGPNAVLALAREGYTHTTVEPAELLGSLRHPGLWRLASKHWRTGVGEFQRSLSKRAFARALQRLVPAIRPEHLRPRAAGVRAQAVTPDGRLVDDFLLQTGERALHVCNAPSPAATASLAIAESIADAVLPPSSSKSG